MKLDVKAITFTERRKTALITAAVMAVSLLIGFRFIYKSSIDSAEAIRKKIAGQKRVNAIFAEAAGYRRQIKNYLQRSSESPQPGRLLEKVNLLAKEAGVVINSIEPARVDSKGNYSFIRCRFSASAPYRKLLLFMDSMETGKGVIIIDAVSLRPVTEAQRDGAAAGGGQPLRQGIYDVFKRTKDDGVWVNAGFEVSSFYAR